MKRLRLGTGGTSTYPFDATLNLENKSDKIIELGEGSGFVASGGSFPLQALLDPKWTEHLEKCESSWLRDLAKLEQQARFPFIASEVRVVFEMRRKRFSQDPKASVALSDEEAQTISELREKRASFYAVQSVALASAGNAFIDLGRIDVGAILLIESLRMSRTDAATWRAFGLALLALEPDDNQDLLRQAMAAKAFAEFSRLTDSVALPADITNSGVDFNAQATFNDSELAVFSDELWDGGTPVLTALDAMPDNAMPVVIALHGVRNLNALRLLCDAIRGRWDDGAARSALKRLATFGDQPVVREAIEFRFQNDSMPLRPYLDFAAFAIDKKWASSIGAESF